MTNTELLERAIAASGYKKSYIAKVIGIGPETLGRKIRNNSEFTASEITALCELLGITSLKEKEAIFFATK